MAEEQRMSDVVDRPLVTPDLSVHQMAISPAKPPGFSSSYSSEYTAKTRSVAGHMSSSMSQLNTPLRPANQSQNAVWKPFQRPGHVVGIPPSYQNSFTVETPSSVRTHVATKPTGPRIQTLARKLASALAPSPVSQLTLNPYGGIGVSDLPSPALKRKAELAQLLKPVHSFKKVKKGETSPEASRDKTSNSTQTKNDDGQSKRAKSNGQHVEAKPGNVSSSKGGKSNVGGRPRGKAGSKTNEQKGPTRLRTNRPVIAEIPIDVWGLVLPYCPLEFLFKARHISKDFEYRLSYESTWRNTRIKNYGPSMPGPPIGLSETQYANLLVGQGCMSCGDKKTRKTYWAFLRRWCSKCLKDKVIMV